MQEPIAPPPVGRSKTLIVGIGSPHGDDQAGWLVAARLAETLDRNEVAVRKAASPAELLDWLDGTDRLIVCDACRGLRRIGEARRWTWPAGELMDAAWSGTHDLPLPAVLQLADRLGRLPRCVVIWSVEGADGTALSTMSSEVEAALPAIADAILAETRSWGKLTPCHEVLCEETLSRQAGSLPHEALCTNDHS